MHLLPLPAAGLGDRTASMLLGRFRDGSVRGVAYNAISEELKLPYEIFIWVYAIFLFTFESFSIGFARWVSVLAI